MIRRKMLVAVANCSDRPIWEAPLWAVVFHGHENRRQGEETRRGVLNEEVQIEACRMVGWRPFCTNDPHLVLRFPFCLLRLNAARLISEQWPEGRDDRDE